MNITLLPKREWLPKVRHNRFVHPEKDKHTILNWDLKSYNLTNGQELVLARRIAKIKQFLNREDRVSEFFFFSRRRFSNVLQCKWKCYSARKILNQKRKSRNLYLKHTSITSHIVYNKNNLLRGILNETIRKNISSFF